MRKSLFMAIICGLLLACSAYAQEAKKDEEAKKDGWWIKAITREPASQMMGFYIGATSQSYGFWRVWSPGSPAEFDVPEELKHSKTLYILAQTTSGQKCAICIMYQSKGVKRLEFDLEEDYQANQSEEDPRCR